VNKAFKDLRDLRDLRDQLEQIYVQEHPRVMSQEFCKLTARVGK
jgi:hypothetical protein